jgi:hypothetical protein
MRASSCICSQQQSLLIRLSGKIYTFMQGLMTQFMYMIWDLWGLYWPYMGLFVLTYQQLLATRRGYGLPKHLDLQSVRAAKTPRFAVSFCEKLRINLVKTIQNQCKNKISRVIIKVRICHFLNPEAYRSLRLSSHVILTILRFFLDSLYGQIFRKAR